MIFAALVTAYLAQASELSDPLVPDFNYVYAVFAEESADRVVSGFGHIFVCVSDKQINEYQDLLSATAINFGAHESIWEGRYSLVPCHEILRKNISLEQRRVTFFELDIPRGKYALLKEDLIRRLKQVHRYDFIRNNCGSLLADWLLFDHPPAPRGVYLTPRRALEKILSQYPPLSRVTVPTGIDLISHRLQTTNSCEIDAVRNALEHPEALPEIRDPVLRLLTLPTARLLSQSAKDSQTIDRELGRLLSRSDSETISRAAVAIRRNKQDQLSAAPWPKNNEGLKIEAGLLRSNKSRQMNPYLALSSGVRDFSTSPVKQDEANLTEILAAQGYASPEGFRLSSITAVEIDRAYRTRSVLKKTSYLVKVGYSRAHQAYRVDGLNALGAWGPSWKLKRLWVSAQAGIIAGQLEGGTPGADICGRLRALHLSQSWTGSISYTHNLDVIDGLHLNAQISLSESVSITGTYTHDLSETHITTFGIRTRF